MPGDRSTPRAANGWGHLAHYSHRFVLPVAASAAVTVGVALGIDYQAWAAAFAPVLLVMVGAAGLATSFAYLRARWHLPATSPTPRPAQRATSPPVPTLKAVARAPPLRGRIPGDANGVSLPATFAKSTSFDPGVPMNATPGDRLWHEWVPEGTGGLEVELVGPVPETYYQLPAPGEFIPFEGKEPDLIFMGEIPRAETGGPGAAGPEAGWTEGSFAFPDPAVRPVEFEAFMPTPPQLRAPTQLTEKRVPFWTSGPSGAPGAASQGCRTCGSGLDDQRWRACSSCAEPVCGDCVLDSLLAHGSLWCAECVPEGGAALAAAG